MTRRSIMKQNRRPIAAAVRLPALLALLLPLLWTGCAGPKETVGPRYRGGPKDVKDFYVDGLRVILRPTGPTNHVIAAKLFIRGGITALPKDVSPAVEELALAVPPLSGPEGMSKPDYRRQLDRMVTGIVPADGRDFSTMTLRCVDEMFDPSWELFTGVIMRPKFDPVELANAKERALIGIRNRLTNPESYAGYLADSAFFYNHPYGRFAQEEDIPPITASVLERYVKNLYVKSRLYLVVVGNVDSADLHRKVAATLAKLPQGSYQEPVVPTPANAANQALIVRPPEGGRKIPTNYLVARYMAPPRFDSLYYATMRLTSFLSGSLFREVRIERNLSYAPDADVNFGRTSFGQITISTTFPDSAWRVAKGEVVDFFRDYIIQDRYMKSGLSGWVTSNYLREQTNESQANELGTATFYTGSWRPAFETYNNIRNLTAEQMNMAARVYLKNFTIVIVGNPEDITPEEYLPPSTGGGEG